MTFFEKVEKLCRNNGISPSNIGAVIPDLQVSRATVTGWKNGAVPRPEKVKAIADYFGVTVDYLMGNEEPENNLYEKLGLIPIKKRKIPMLGEIACGQPIFANEDRDFYVMLDTDLDVDFCLRAKGDSMIGARILDGDIVFIKQCSMVDNGEIAAVSIEDEATLKRVYYYPKEGKLILQAENPKYAPLVYIGEELNRIHIIGRAVAFQSWAR